MTGGAEWPGQRRPLKAERGSATCESGLVSEPSEEVGEWVLAALKSEAELVAVLTEGLVAGAGGGMASERMDAKIEGRRACRLGVRGSALGGIAGGSSVGLGEDMVGVSVCRTQRTLLYARALADDVNTSSADIVT